MSCNHSFPLCVLYVTPILHSMIYSHKIFYYVNLKNYDTPLYTICLFVFLALQPIVVVFSQRCPTHSTTRVTTYTRYMYCCHNTGIELQDFKFSVLNDSVTLTRYRPTP